MWGEDAPAMLATDDGVKYRCPLSSIAHLDRGWRGGGIRSLSPTNGIHRAGWASIDGGGGVALAVLGGNERLRAAHALSGGMHPLYPCK